MPAASYTLGASGGTNSLIIDDTASGGTGSIAVLAGTHYIQAPLQLNSNTDLFRVQRSAP